MADIKTNSEVDSALINGREIPVGGIKPLNIGYCIIKLNMNRKFNIYTNYTWRCYMSEKQWKPGETVSESATYVAYDAQGHDGGSLYLEKGKRKPEDNVYLPVCHCFHTDCIYVKRYHHFAIYTIYLLFCKTYKNKSNPIFNS